MSVEYVDHYLPSGFEFLPGLPRIIKNMSLVPISERRARRLANEVKALRRGR